MYAVRIYILLLLLISIVSGIYAQTEICNNGIDDDGDGFVDHFDSDCNGAQGGDSFYFGQPVPTCRVKPPVLDYYNLVQKFNTKIANSPDPQNPTHEYPVDQRCGVFVGDLDNDGVPEMIGMDADGTRNLRVFSGIDGAHLASAPVFTRIHSQPAIANVDPSVNNYGDIFVVTNANEIMRVEYNHNGSSFELIQRFKNKTQKVYNRGQSPQLADFNMDGVPEVYVGNMIYNAIDGQRYVNGEAAGCNRGCMSTNRGASDGDSWPIAYDVFKEGDLIPGGGGATFDSKAQGLELIAGNKVYLVHFDPSGAVDNGSLTEAVVVSIDGLTDTESDGFTSLSDINYDNKIDIVVAASDGSAKVYAYDPYFATQIGTTYDVGNLSTKAGRCNVANFDGQPGAEIGVAGKHVYTVIRYNPGLNTLETLWRKTGDGTNDGSQIYDVSELTGSTVFDFEGDGAAEVIFSDEHNLYVWRGSDGAELAKVSSPSGTRMDYPIVVDVDDDGQAEIVVTSQDKPAPGFSTGRSFISVFRSTNAPWVSARETWNQHGYFVNNIGPELTIPKQQQDIVNYNFFQQFNEAFNGFLVQTTFLTYGAEPTYAVGDLSIENVLVDLNQCVSQKEVTFTVTLKNNGDWKIPRRTPVAVFDGNPYETAARYLGTFYTPENIEVGASAEVSHTVVDTDGDGWMNLFVLANHYEESVAVGDVLPAKLEKNHSPVLECNYINNIGLIGHIEDCVLAHAPGVDLDRDDSSGATGTSYATAFAIQTNVVDVIPVVICDQDIHIADDNDATLQSAVISITNLFDTGYEFLNHPNEGAMLGAVSITKVSDGQIELNGNGTLEEYENIIKAITYKNLKTSGINQDDRLIHVTVSDGVDQSQFAVATICLKIQPTLDLDADDSSVSGRDFYTTFIEGDKDLSVVDTDVVINTDGNIALQKVSVALSNIEDGANETLRVVGSLPAGISVSVPYENGIGVIELVGEAPAEAYQTALRQIVYNNTSNNPNTTSRVLHIKVNDGYLESLVANTTIGIIPVNDAPVIMGPLATAIYTWGEVPICAVPTVSVTDADDELIESGLIEISTGLQSGDVLTSTYAGANITALVTSGKIVLTGPASLAEFEAYLTALQFSTTAAAGIRVLSITLNDGDDDSNIYSRIISVDVPAVNDDPVALDDTYEVDEYVVLTIGNEAGMMRNDIDPDGDVISVQSVDHATYGTLIWNANGSFTYTQNIGNAELGVGESLVETLSYTINDGNGAIATANVTIVINGVNDMPTAMTDNVSVNENESVAMGTNHGLLSNDTDPNAGDDIRITSVNGTSNARNTGSYGELIWSALGDFTYTPDNSIDAVNQMKATDYLVETFRYMMSDGNGGKATADLVITIFGQNDAPVVADDVAEVEEGATLNGASLLLNDMDPDGDDLIISTFPLEEPLNGALDIHSDGTYTYKPNAYFFGTDTFTYEVCDDNNPQACATAQVVITVNQVELDNFEVLEGYSPNGDGVNDKFTIDWLYRFEKVSFEIFNRWGNVVYRQDRYDNNWNGYSNVGLTIGKELPVGTYYYVINIKDIGVSLNGYIYLNR